MKQLKTGFTPCDPLLELNHIHHSAFKQLYSTLGRLWLTTPSLSELNHIYHSSYSTMSPAKMVDMVELNREGHMG